MSARQPRSWPTPEEDALAALHATRPAQRARDVAPPVRATPEAYGPVASLPSAPPRWRWSEVKDVPEQLVPGQAGPYIWPHPLDRKRGGR